MRLPPLQSNSNSSVSHLANKFLKLSFLPERDYATFGFFAVANPSVVCRLSVVCKVRETY